jgi:hypothetical protein
MTNPTENSEGPVARAIEEHTAKLPSDVFLWAAGAPIATSLILKVLDRHHDMRRFLSDNGLPRF